MIFLHAGAPGEMPGCHQALAMIALRGALRQGTATLAAVAAARRWLAGRFARATHFRREAHAARLMAITYNNSGSPRPFCDGRGLLISSVRVITTWK